MVLNILNILDDVIDDKPKEINELEIILENFHRQLLEEIQNFKNLRQKDLLNIMKKFFTEKFDFDVQVAKVYDNSNNNNGNNNDQQLNSSHYSEDHFY